MAGFVLSKALLSSLHDTKAVGDYSDVSKSGSSSGYSTPSLPATPSLHSMVSSLHTMTVSGGYEDEDEIPYVRPNIIFSEEQKAIAAALKDGKNVIVDAVAGSGKTSSIMHVSEEIPEKRILALLYNKMLADESRSKIGSSNIEIRTIHSAAGVCYRSTCPDDRGLQNILSQDLPYQYNKFDIVIVDEAQDLTPILAKIVRKIIKDSGATQLAFIGDWQQSIYVFADADERFLTMADTFFGDLVPGTVVPGTVVPGTVVPGIGEWVRLPLSETYRCTKSMVDFINVCLLHDNRLKSTKESFFRPEYVVCDAFNCEQMVNQMIEEYLLIGNSLEDIAILGFSVNSEKSPIVGIANYLANAGKPIFKPNDDRSSIRDDRLLKGKIVLSTFHQFKGRERKMVIIVGFDNFFYNYSKEANRETCPNVLYVAATRSKERLVFLQNKRDGPLPFLNTGRLMEFAHLVGPFPGDPKSKSGPLKTRTFSISDLIKFLPHSFLMSIRGMWTDTQEVAPQKETEIDSVVSFNSTFEDVSAIYGSSVPILKQWQLQGHLILFKSLAQLLGMSKELALEGCVAQAAQLDQMVRSGHQLTWEQIAWLVNLHNCILDRYVHPMRQITKYDWFEKNLNSIFECVARLGFLNKEDLFEEHVSFETRAGPSKVRVFGAIDCIQKTTAWEFKMVSELKEEHVIQTVLYASCLYLQTGKYLPFRLFNSRTGETRRIDILPQNAQLFLQRIVEHKLRSGDNRKSLPELLASVGL
jgi:hypothetical protein